MWFYNGPKEQLTKKTNDNQQENMSSWIWKDEKENKKEICMQSPGKKICLWIEFIEMVSKARNCKSKKPTRKKERGKNDRQKKCGGKLSNCENPKHIHWLIHSHLVQISVWLFRVFFCWFAFIWLHLLACFDHYDLKRSGSWWVLWAKKNCERRK